MELRRVFLVVIFIFIMKMASSSESDYENYYNGTSLPSPYDLTTTSGEQYAENGNASFPDSDSTPHPFTPKGLVDDSEEENLQNQATTKTTTTTSTPAPTYSPETVPTTIPAVSANTTLPPSPGFSTEASNDNLGNKGNGQGGGHYGETPKNPSPAGPVPGAPIPGAGPIQDGVPGSGIPTADGSDGSSFCVCLVVCLTTSTQPQAPPGTGPCASICACIGNHFQSDTPSPGGGSKDVPGGGFAPPSPPIADIPAATVGATDTAHGAVQDGTSVAGSAAPPPPQSQNP